MGTPEQSKLKCLLSQLVAYYKIHLPQVLPVLFLGNFIMASHHWQRKRLLNKHVAFRFKRKSTYPFLSYIQYVIPARLPGRLYQRVQSCKMCTTHCMELPKTRLLDFYAWWRGHRKIWRCPEISADSGLLGQANQAQLPHSWQALLLT